MPELSFFISDLHMGINGPENLYQARYHEAGLKAVLRHLTASARDMRDLVILGDWFDMLASPPDRRPYALPEVVAANPGVFEEEEGRQRGFHKPASQGPRASVLHQRQPRSVRLPGRHQRHPRAPLRAAHRRLPGPRAEFRVPGGRHPRRARPHAFPVLPSHDPRQPSRSPFRNLHYASPGKNLRAGAREKRQDLRARAQGARASPSSASKRPPSP